MCLFGLEIRKDAASTVYTLQRERERLTRASSFHSALDNPTLKSTKALERLGADLEFERATPTRKRPTTLHTHFTLVHFHCLPPENTRSPQSVSRDSRFPGMIGQKLTTPCGAGDCPPARRCRAPQCSGRAPWCSPRGSACRPRTTRWSTSRTARWEAGRGAASGR